MMMVILVMILVGRVEPLCTRVENNGESYTIQGALTPAVALGCPIPYRELLLLLYIALGCPTPYREPLLLQYL